jgi:hypothetical protein
LLWSRIGPMRGGLWTPAYSRWVRARVLGHPPIPQLAKELLMSVRILEIREATHPISSTIANAYIDFSRMTCSLVAVVTDAIRRPPGCRVRLPLQWPAWAGQTGAGAVCAAGVGSRSGRSAPWERQQPGVGRGSGPLAGASGGRATLRIANGTKHFWTLAASRDVVKKS